MDHRLRSRGEKKVFSGFTTAEMEKMEKVIKETEENPLNPHVFKILARGFNRSTGRAGKPLLKWTDVQSWFIERQKNPMSITDPPKMPAVQEACTLKNVNGTSDISKGEKVSDLSELEFEAKSADHAWYDVEVFITHRFTANGPEVRVRYIGFGTEEDEWVHVKNVRERSVPLDNSECHKVIIGDTILCFQEKLDQARYYDAKVINIQRKLHDIRGCRCIFLIRYEHDGSEESVRLKRICCRPEY